ncbi:NUDIX domain-containing protein [Stenotrophomonas maltophilia]|uniref:NUDIX hydrolase n=3 Tax=Stenotrophomonas maltophilia TaxID=40324 RepID=B4SK81_STRM5|nr:NUDIX domain-containing protein [Stenotrophomonas maltophilia]ACF51799.1 NUDIX hydrolase [Stenotrophomonas maltophilia R551-3]MBA0394029.1 NUDIX domain-containing protein [Stenotrophomonas maltophilia]MBH1493278.1 NUDIX domain-containing protein [Stenotrophomonas maltophilia]MBN4960651.1 NUDIX domain-containing protein [Stenotrophomonas maltophilia]PJL41482.1 NUDIX hydrolase [Stenotrophomonas maltophilia]
MTQVYATLRSGNQYLIARKQITNAWWSGYAAPVLVAEAAAALVTVANVAADAPVDADALAVAVTAINATLGNAALAAKSAWPGLNPATGAATRAAIDLAVAAVSNAGQALDQLQAAVPAVFTAVNRAARMGADQWPPAAPGAPTPPWAMLTVPDMAVWPIAGLQARVNAALERIRNWAGTRPATLVNQAGQWALPGGRMGDAEAAEDAARREFLEETGIVLGAPFAMAFHTLFQTAPQGPQFYLVCFDIPADQDIAELATNINVNLMARPTWLNRPTAGAVVDWELDIVSTVAQNELSAYLGAYQATRIPENCVPVPVPVPVGAAAIAAWEYRQRRFADSQSIDWYLRMARYIEQQ